jgi:tetratricopeptide (TPR) repeat protein
MLSSSVYNHPWSKATLDRVAPILTAVLATAPKHVAARRLAAKFGDEHDRPGDTLRYSIDLLDDGESSVELYEYAITALHSLDRLDEALAMADRACAAFPGAAEPVALRAQALMDTGRGEEAVAAARHAVELAPDDPDQHCALGRVLGDLDDEPETKEAAKQAFLAALALDPDHVRSRFELGTLRMLAFQDYPRAEEEFLRITIPDPSGERTACLGQVRFLQGKWDQALADFETALAMPMRTPQALEIVVGTLEYFGAPEPFRDVYEHCVALLGRPVPDGLERVEPLVGLGFLMVKAGADDKAAALAALALRLDPDSEDASVLAEALADPDDPEIAEALAGLRYAPLGD